MYLAQCVQATYIRLHGGTVDPYTVPIMQYSQANTYSAMMSICTVRVTFILHLLHENISNRREMLHVPLYQQMMRGAPWTGHHNGSLLRQ